MYFLPFHPLGQCQAGGVIKSILSFLVLQYVSRSSLTNAEWLCYIKYVRISTAAPEIPAVVLDSKHLCHWLHLLNKNKTLLLSSEYFPHPFVTDVYKGDKRISNLQSPNPILSQHENSLTNQRRHTNKWRCAKQLLGFTLLDIWPDSYIFHL